MLLESIMKKYGYYNHYNKPLNELSVGGESIDDIDDDNFELNDNEDEEDPPTEQGEGNPAEDDTDTEDPNFGETDDDTDYDFTPTSDNPEDNMIEIEIDDNPSGGEEETPPEDNMIGSDDNDNAEEISTDDVNDADTAGDPVAAPTPDNGEDESADDTDAESDFSIPDEAGEDQGGDDATDNTGDDTDDPTTGGDDVDTDFSVDDAGGGDESGDTGEDQGGGNDATIGGDEDTEATDAGDTSNLQGDESPDEIQAAEDKLYDSLTDDQKALRRLQLKLDYNNLYHQTDIILNSINNIPKSDDNIESLNRLVDTVNKLKQYLVDYITIVFDKKTYLENAANYIKYINAFRTIDKVITDISKPRKD